MYIINLKIVSHKSVMEFTGRPNKIKWVAHDYRTGSYQARLKLGQPLCKIIILLQNTGEHGETEIGGGIIQRSQIIVGQIDQKMSQFFISHHD